MNAKIDERTSGLSTRRKVRFHEVMRGRLAAAAAMGSDIRILMLVLDAEVLIEDLDAFLVSPNRRGRLSGQIQLDSDDAHPADGFVELFVVGDQPGHRLMRYQASFTIGSDKYTLVGTKHVLPRRGLYTWRDVTTLYTAVWRLDPEPHVIAAGTLRLSLWQGICLLTTLRGSGVGILSGLSAALRFVCFFLVEVALQFVGWPR
jgi:hypothetical protein